MSIMSATSSQNNRGGNGRFTPLRRNGASSQKVGHFDTTDLMDTLNRIDDRNIMTIFKQAKDPVELAFDHIDKQPFKKVATDAIKDSVADIQMGFEDLKDSMGEIKSSFGDFFGSVIEILTSNKEFIPENI